MSPYSLFSGECSVVLITLYPTMQGSDSPNTFLAWQMTASATNQNQSQGGKKCTRDLASTVFPERWGMRKAFLHGRRKKTISTLNCSKPSRTSWVQILRIVRKHKDETVNIFSKGCYRQFFSYYKERKYHVLGFRKNSVYRIFFSLSKNNYFSVINKS